MNPRQMTTINIRSQLPPLPHHRSLTKITNVCISGPKFIVFRLSLPLLLWTFGHTFAKNGQKTITRYRSTDPKVKVSGRRTRSNGLQSIEFFPGESTSFSYDSSLSFQIERSYRPALPTASKSKRKPSSKSTTSVPTSSPTTRPTVPFDNSPTSSGSMRYPIKKTPSPNRMTPSVRTITPSSSPTTSPTLSPTSAPSTRNPTSAPSLNPTETVSPVITLPPINNVSGYTYCSSIPAYFVWQLNFTLSCEPPNIKYGRGTGIGRYTCNIDSSDNSVTDLSPVIVQEYQIVELDDSLYPIFAEHHRNLALYQGDIISYTSVAVSNPSVKLGGISMKLVGTNSFGDAVDLLWTVEYRNSSSNAIVFCPGDSIGWTNFVSTLGEPDGLQYT